MQKSASISKLRADTPGSERRIGKYAFIASLASGGMAKVYLAVTRGSVDFKKLVVIKEMLPKLAADPAFVEMFMNEARIAARLNHPNVIHTYEVGSEGARQFLAMEYLDGVPYTRLARQKDRASVPLLLHVRVLIEVLRGLHYAHELTDFDGTPLHVVHRDVSPQNILLTYDGHVKLLDFGIAKAVSSEPDKKGNELKGKVAYMAPEQITGDEVDRRADLFCVGIQLWEAATGKRLWDRSAGSSIPHQVLYSEIPDVRDLKPDAPRRLAEICARALARPPGERYATAADMEHDLEEFLDSTGKRVTTRDVGKFIAAKYISDRTQMRGVIDQQLKELGTLSPDESSRIELAQLAQAKLSDRPSAPAPSNMPPAGESAASGTNESPSGIWPKTAPGEAAGEPVVTSGTRARGGSRWSFALAALILVIVGGFVAVRALRKRPAVVAVDARTVANPEAPGAQATAPESGRVAPPIVDFKIKASPAEARVSIDGVPAVGNPFVGQRLKDNKPHLVKVEAPGYEPKVETVEFARDFFLAVELKRLSRGTWGPAAAAPPPANKLRLDPSPYKEDKK